MEVTVNPGALQIMLGLEPQTEQNPSDGFLYNLSCASPAGTPFSAPASVQKTENLTARIAQPSFSTGFIVQGPVWQLIG